MPSKLFQNFDSKQNNQREKKWSTDLSSLETFLNDILFVKFDTMEAPLNHALLLVSYIELYTKTTKFE